jgi:hypothetical protein
MIDLAQRARERFAYVIGEKAACDELRVQRMLGAEWIDAYLNAWAVADEVAQLVYAEDRPAVHLPCRYIRKPR